MFQEIQDSKNATLRCGKNENLCTKENTNRTVQGIYNTDLHVRLLFLLVHNHHVYSNGLLRKEPQKDIWFISGRLLNFLVQRGFIPFISQFKIGNVLDPSLKARLLSFPRNPPKKEIPHFSPLCKSFSKIQTNFLLFIFVGVRELLVSTIPMKLLGIVKMTTLSLPLVFVFLPNVSTKFSFFYLTVPLTL